MKTLLQNGRSGFRQKAGFFAFPTLAALYRDAATPQWLVPFESAPEAGGGFVRSSAFRRFGALTTFSRLKAELQTAQRQGGFARRRERDAFSLVEILIVVALLSLIVLALMGVFSSTQRAFRASVTQTDVLEGGRAVVGLITSDLRKMTPSISNSNLLDASGFGGYTRSGCAVNFFVTNNYYNYSPLVQSLPGSSARRTNLLQWFFILGRENTKWTGVGYAVDTGSASYLYPLYRFYGEVNIASDPAILFNNFVTDVNAGCTNMNHVMDGVVHLVVRAFDVSGTCLTNGYGLGQRPTVKNTLFTPPYPPFNGEVGMCMFSKSLPASVELQLGLLEDRALKRAESLPNNAPLPSPNDRRTLYLQGQSGSVHLFRQQVNIPNVDRAAYQ